MALFPLRGVLVEYGANILGPIPNIVIFQFNPENMTRTITIPPPPASASARPRVETHAAAAPPSERFEISAHFSAADDLGAGGAVSAIPRLFGVGPQIAALEKMVYPQSTPGGLIGAAIDAIGAALSGPGSTPPTQPVPRVPTAAHPVHLGTVTGAAGDHHLDVHQRTEIRPVAQPGAGRSQDRHAGFQPGADR
jgi:hypothetical protein